MHSHTVWDCALSRTVAFSLTHAQTFSFEAPTLSAPLWHAALGLSLRSEDIEHLCGSAELAECQRVGQGPFRLHRREHNAYSLSHTHTCARASSRSNTQKAWSGSRSYCHLPHHSLLSINQQHTFALTTCQSHWLLRTLMAGKTLHESWLSIYCKCRCFLQQAKTNYRLRRLLQRALQFDAPKFWHAGTLMSECTPEERWGEADLRRLRSSALLTSAYLWNKPNNLSLAMFQAKRLSIDLHTDYHLKIQEGRGSLDRMMIALGL